jgi:hypothetical protein
LDRKVFLYSVVASIIAAALFVWGLKPFTGWVLQAGTSNAWTRLQNELFTNAALGTRDWLSVNMYLAVLYGFVMLFFYLIGIALGVGARKVTSGRITEIGAVRTGLSHGLAERVVVALLAVLLVIVFGYLSKLSFLAYADLQLNAAFNQRMSAIGPYISVPDEKQLRAAWALMKTRDDYLRINDTLENHANKANITLPHPLYD